MGCLFLPEKLNITVMLIFISICLFKIMPLSFMTGQQNQDEDTDSDSSDD